MKKNSLRTSAFGVVVGLALATGLGVGATMLSASVSTPAAQQTQSCDKPAICPLQDKVSCPVNSKARADVSRQSCPGKSSI